MDLQNTFTVPVPIDEAWTAVLDVARLAPCMPGATVDEVLDDDVLGRVKVRLGPITMTYEGRVTFTERDVDNHCVVVDASAREIRGNGTATARISASLKQIEPTVTEVSVTTDLNVTGKPAQFGRNLMTDVSERLIGEFAVNLAQHLARPPVEVGGDAHLQSEAPLVDAAGVVAHSQKQARESAAAFDLLRVLRAPVLKRLVPVLAVVIAALWGLRMVHGRRVRGSGTVSLARFDAGKERP